MSDANLPNVPMNYSRITERLFLGSRPRDAADVAELERASVSHILNLCTEPDPIEGSIFQTLPERYCWNPTADDGQPKSVEWFQTSLRFVMPLLAKPGWICFLHCVDGMDRSAATAYAILRAIGLTRIDAVVMIKVHRPIALWKYLDSADSALVHGW